MSKPIPRVALCGLLTAALVGHHASAETGSLSFEKLDSDNNGLISKSEGEEMPELNKQWDRIDEDDSGAIDRQEFSAIKEKPDLSTQKQDFAQLDVDNNGYITAIEAREAPWLQEMWSQLDDDNSGALDRQEYRSFEAAPDEMRGLLKQQRFDELDEDRDGVISVGEVRDHPELREIWPQVDADNSGAVDREEFTQWAGAKEGTELLSQAPPFERLDEDGNGHITAVEGREMPLLHRNWSRFDTDNSGAIDPREFKEFLERRQQGELAASEPGQGEQEAATPTGVPSFEQLDEDNNGYITAVEGRENPALHRNWSEFDTDNSGAIDRAEFSAFEAQRQGTSAAGNGQQEIHEKAKEQMRQDQTR